MHEVEAILSNFKCGLKYRTADGDFTIKNHSRIAFKPHHVNDALQPQVYYSLPLANRNFNYSMENTAGVMMQEDVRLTVLALANIQ